MRKLIWGLLVFCSLGGSAMAAQQPESSGLSSEGISSKPKESFLLLREKFSDSADINYDGLEEHIHYKFNNRELLKDALYPMVPKRIKAQKLRFDQQEFLGDSVLGLIVRERLVVLFPKEDRGLLSQLYDLLTKNQTLADVYFRNLELERYIPVPEKASCKICNLVEALIGGIYLDDPTNGYINSKVFVMHILNDHVLAEKVRELSLLKSIKLGSPVFPELDETIKIVCTAERLISDSPKTLLNEVLLRLWTDRPSYEVSVKINGDRVPRFFAIVSGAQIGRVLHGEGDTSQEAEEDAARNALNFLAKRELLENKNKEIAPKTFRTRLKEYLDILDYNWEFENVTPLSVLRVQIKFNNMVVGEGTGNSQEEARKMAAQQACHTLGMTSIPQVDRLNGSKNYRTLLKEFNEISGHHNYKFEEPTLKENVYNCQVEIENDIVVSGTGSSKAEAREDVAKKAFLLLGKESHQDRPLLRLFLMLEGLDRCEFNNITSCQTFIYRVIDGDNIVAEGTGLSGSEAKENAAREAYFRLIQLETEKAEYRDKLKRGERLKSPTFKSSSVVKPSPVTGSTLSLISASAQPKSKQGAEVGTRKKAIKKRPGKAVKSQDQSKLDESAKPSALKMSASKPSLAGKQPSLAVPKLSQKSTPKKNSAEWIPKEVSDKKSATMKPSSTSETQ